jgi:benzoate membrane transport protein
MVVFNVALSIYYRMPVTIAWSTPGAALLVSTGATAGGFPAATGAFLVAGIMVILAGLWRPFGRAVASIPMPLASAMLAGILLELCLAPVRAVGAMPLLALPIVLVWAIALRFARLYAVPLAVAVTAIIVVFATPLPPASLLAVWPQPIFIPPEFHPGAVVTIAVPLFLVTMASQNVPGLAVFNANGFRPPVGPLFVATGLGSVVISFFGGHAVNLAAITAALCAGPEAHPDPSKRWIASLTCGLAYIVLASGAGFAAAFVVASPPLLIQAVAGLALLASLASAAHAALADHDYRLPAIVTFVTTVSGLVVFGIGSAFWGLLAGGLMALLLRRRRG